MKSTELLEAESTIHAATVLEKKFSAKAPSAGSQPQENIANVELPTLIGHRGARGEAPENTLASFIHAYELGIRDFELDIRLSKDGVLMVNHDITTLRTTGTDGNIEALNSIELMQLDARKNTSGWPTLCPIPTLEQVLNACPNVQSWQFEVKTTSVKTLKDIAKALNSLIVKRNLIDVATVTSLDKRMVRIMQATNPNIKRGYVCEKLSKNPIETALKYQCSHLCLNYKIASEALVAQAKAYGLHVSCWTVNDLKSADALIKSGVDSLIVDYPSAFMGYFNIFSKRHF